MFSSGLPKDLPLRPVSEMGLKELERLRLILRGSSVIDWRRLHFGTRAQVDHFLKLCELDMSRPHDDEWARTLLADAVDYLRRTFRYRVPRELARPKEIHDLFLLASEKNGKGRARRIACILLKVMHVLQHIEARDLLFRLPVSEEDIAELLTTKVVGVAAQMQDRGLPVAEFSDSVKTRESLITKLIAKEDTVAAQVYDRIRFRIITHRYEDLLPVLYDLTKHLFPFNFVVPGQSENSLLPFREVVRSHPNFQRYAEALQLDVGYEEREEEPLTTNQFSGETYRALNFVVDVPLRMDDFLPAPESDHRARKGRIVFGQCEFQIIDAETARNNEQGENSHERYKRRQRVQVLRRLARGLIIPQQSAQAPGNGAMSGVTSLNEARRRSEQSAPGPGVGSAPEDDEQAG
jgi:uncharacterized protein (TIGR04552 family)